MKKKITLNFKNGSTIEFKEDHKFKVIVNWEGVNSVLIEQWLTVDQFKKLCYIQNNISEGIK